MYMECQSSGKYAPDIPEDFENLDQFIEDLFETMHASDGVGLAAPQVGKSLRIFVIDTSPIRQKILRTQS